MGNNIAIRDAYGEALLNLGKKNDKVVVLEADVGASTKSILFGKEFPERYFNVGISEFNMVAMSAGFATQDLIPFVNTFAVFMTTRGSDPIQSLIAYDKLNVKIAGNYAGLSDSYDGASHQAITDIAVVRSMPNMTVVSVSDAVETAKAVEAIAEYDGPVYLRLSRAPAPVIFDENYDFRIGKGVELKTGKDVAIIATGTILHNALKAADLLKEEGIEATVINIHTIKPIDEELIIDAAKRTGAVLTVEEHSIHGGLGSAVAEVLSKACPTPIEFVGATKFAESGDYNELLEKYGYGPKSIAEKAKLVIKNK
ncbi:MAG: transketolase [Defluviitaleaceae bacterium]|jgi:transketolase|uniref:Transketolase family protein n=1 Tax=Defluviitalea raffinosedens TaxID=1450156 RepID=A0A7C8HED9_9FIRM|nr:transketolase family protein [Defluviitalea raffinosedens]KAE9634008.1 transketolase family protein [Defluviitalea raffinosedens]MBZ4668365.1 transketolase [Defluviitaleaceae bacterium]HHW67949.1 transketolase family protein [Candidatus Epulonipiscium sp.]